MVTNLYGETVMGIDDVCKMLTQRSVNNGVFDLIPNQVCTKQGYYLSPKAHVSVHKLPGFYSIFKENILEYIGKSECDIGYRLSRFVKEVNFESRSDESHGAGDKWRTWYGFRNFDNCKIMFSEYYPFEAKEHLFSYEAIEKHLIYLYKPRMNIK